jgi:hypothetical protein
MTRTAITASDPYPATLPPDFWSGSSAPRFPGDGVYHAKKGLTAREKLIVSNITGTHAYVENYFRQGFQP